jgi:hypothetical protein
MENQHAQIIQTRTKKAAAAVRIPVTPAMLREAAPVYVEEGLVDDEVPVAPATPEG